MKPDMSVEIECCLQCVGHHVGSHASISCSGYNGALRWTCKVLSHQCANDLGDDVLFEWYLPLRKDILFLGDHPI